MSPGSALPPGLAAAAEAKKEVEAYSPIMVLMLRELHAISPPSQFAKHVPTFYLYVGICFPTQNALGEPAAACRSSGAFRLCDRALHLSV